MKKRSLLSLLFLVNIQLNAQFAQGVVLDSASSRPTVDLFVDLDGDLDLDVVIQYNTEIVWMENTGSGDFASPVTLISDLEYWDNLQVADIDNDGLMDIIINYNYYIEPDGYISWYENNGDGTFTENIIVTEKANDIVVKDYDDDGDMDLIYLLPTEIKYAQNTGGGVFAAPTSWVTGLTETQKLFFTDFDNDGNEDIVYTEDWSEGGAFYSEYLGPGLYAATSIQISYWDYFSAVDRIVFLDIDDDGDDDWFVKFGFEMDYGNIYFYENTGGVLATETLITNSSGDFEIADLNNNGEVDLVVSDGPSYYKWFEGNGDGTFDSPITLDIPDTDSESGDLQGANNILTADLDLDGDLEIYGDMSLDHYFFVEYSNLIIDDYTATGKLFIDINENEIQDLGEPGAGFIPVISTPDALTSYTFDDGTYTMAFIGEDGFEYEIEPELPMYWAISTDSLSYTVIIDGGTLTDSLDFGIYPTADVDSIETHLTGAFPRCNDTINYWINVNNVGTTRPSGFIDLELHDSLIYVSAEIVPDSIVDNHYYWHYDSLSWFSTDQIKLQVKMPDFMSEGDTVISYLTSTIVTMDDVVYTATNMLEQIVICAYDPNDKIAYPSGIDEPGYISNDTEIIEYTVRFQNTGSDTAITVLIKDQLDANLDRTSVIPLASSHPMELAIDVDGEMTFEFENIMLPDSNVNEIASHGFVKYSILLNDGVPDGTAIDNSAEIYFDLNPAVLTNTKTLTLYNCNIVFDNVNLPETVCFGDTIYGTIDDFPMPSSTEFEWILDGESVMGDSIYALLDEAGLHDIEVIVTTGFCESSEIFTVEVFPEIPAETLPEINICIGDSALIFDTYQSAAGYYSEILTSLTGCDSVIYQQLIFYDLPDIELVALAEDEIFCLDETAISLSGSPEGGIFAGEGVVADTFDPSAVGEGDYTLYYSFEDDNGCLGSDSIAVSVVDCLGLTADLTSAMSIHPNPAADQVVITVKGEFNYSVIDIAGKLILSGSGTDTVALSVATVPAGTYIVNIQNNELTQTMKLVVRQ